MTMKSRGRGGGGKGPQFKRYPKYRDSGVGWLGEIPEHWEVRRTESFCRHKKSLVEPNALAADEVFHYSIPNIQETGDGALEFPAEIGSAKLRITGIRLLVSKLNPRKGVVVLANEKKIPTICSTEFVPLEPRGCHPQWVLYLFLSEYARQHLSARVRSATRSHQRAEVADVLKMSHGVPPVGEQRAIADFLGRETERIDGLIAKKERLVGLLQERRTALISRAATRGLDPDAPTRETGVEWLGAIPAHWQLRRLKALSEMKSGESITSTSIQDSGPYPVFGGNGLRGYASSFTHEGEHLLIGRQGALCGNVHVARGRFWASEHAVVLTPDQPKEVEWLGALLEAMDLNQYSIAAAQPGLAVDRLRDLQIPVPPDSERRTIADFLGLETARIDALVTKVTAAIERLNEYRAALISAAVTGAIDVRRVMSPERIEIEVSLQ